MLMRVTGTGMALYTYMRSTLTCTLPLMFVCLFSAGCAKPPAPILPPPPPPPPKPTVFQISIAVATDVNPDVRGRASPVVAKMYELKNLAAFQSADFFALLDHEKDVLGDDLVAKDEVVLQPGKAQNMTREIHPEARFVGVFAAYRDIEHSKWRASVPVELNATSQIEINVQAHVLSMTKTN
ncbi:MAG: hypothetical protein NVSMB6_14680 [Burkholderiaceae bacterium]